MPAKAPDQVVAALALDIPLHGLRKGEVGVSRAELLHAAPQRFLAAVGEPGDLRRRLAEHIGPRGVADPAAVGDPDVDLEDVAALHGLAVVAGGAVDDAVVDREAG